MTKNKKRKADVRERMAKTGERYAAANAQLGGKPGANVAMPTERRHLGGLVAHGRAMGDYPWDHWFERARREGVGEDLAHLGRSLMREADQHGWCRALHERCGWTEQSAAGMIRFALEGPSVAKKHWERLMETDGGIGVFEANGLRELTDEEFEREYVAFALAFDRYFPASRAPADDADPWVEVPGLPGILAPRSRVTEAAQAGRPAKERSTVMGNQDLDENEEVEINLGDGRVARGHPTAIRKYQEARELEKARAARWPRRSDGGVDAKRAMTVLAHSFPTLANAPGLEPFDSKAFVRWLCTSGEPGGGARRAARFILQVWNPTMDWRAFGRELGVDPEVADEVLRPFNVAGEIGGWDEKHHQAFLSWCEAPFWP